MACGKKSFILSQNNIFVDPDSPGLSIHVSLLTKGLDFCWKIYYLKKISKLQKFWSLIRDWQLMQYFSNLLNCLQKFYFSKPAKLALAKRLLYLLNLHLQELALAKHAFLAFNYCYTHYITGSHMYNIYSNKSLIKLIWMFFQLILRLT